jgi:hypothetical protein
MQFFSILWTCDTIFVCTPSQVITVTQERHLQCKFQELRRKGKLGKPPTHGTNSSGEDRDGLLNWNACILAVDICYKDRRRLDEVQGHLGVTLHVGSTITADRCQETIPMTQEGRFRHTLNHVVFRNCQRSKSFQLKEHSYRAGAYLKTHYPCEAKQISRTPSD